jgi:ketosteroid isomerase-like protein
MKNAMVVLLLLLTVMYSNAQNEAPEKSPIQNLAVVSSYFEFLFRRGDFVSLEKLILKEAVYTQADGLPYGGTYVGFNQWLAMFGKVQSYFELKLVSDEILYNNADNNTVAANFIVQFKSRKTNQTIEMPIMELFELKDGKIFSVKPFYFDTKKINDFSK